MTKTLPVMIRLALFICWTFSQVPLVLSSGNLQLEIQSLRNIGIEPGNSVCCDSSSTCSFPCDIILRMCLSYDHFKQNYPNGLLAEDSFDCPQGYTESYFSLQFANQTSFLSVRQFFFIPFDGTWLGDVSLRIQLLRRSDSAVLDRFGINYNQPDAYESGGLFKGRSFTATGVRPISPTSVDLRLAAVCDKKSLAPNCIEECQAQDDCFAHYQCDPVTGKKVCLTGWTGTDCNERTGLVETCQGNICLNGADCIRNGTNQYCCCTPDWKGENCGESVDIDISKISQIIDDEYKSHPSLENDKEPAPWSSDQVIVSSKARFVRQAIGQDGLSTRVGVLPVLPTATGDDASLRNMGVFFAGHRPTFNVNNQSDPQVFQTMDLINHIQQLDRSFGVHRVALLNPPTSIQQLESSLQSSWYSSNLAALGVGQNALVIRVISFQEYGLFSDTGLPVIDVIYAVGLNRSALVDSHLDPNSSVSQIPLPFPEITALSNQLLKDGLRLCDCDVYQGQLLNLVGIVNFTPLIGRFHDAVKNAWLTTIPELSCQGCIVDVRFARTVITIGAMGVRLTTAPYIILLNGKVWSPMNPSSDVTRGPPPILIENVARSPEQTIHIYRNPDTPVYAALTFVNFLNANIQYQDTPAVQHSLQSYVTRSFPQPVLQAKLWNLEPFLNPEANIITQSSYFLTLPNGVTLDPRLYYAPPVIAALANQTEGNVTVVTGKTLGIHPLYLTGQIQPAQLRSIAEILKLTYAEANPSLSPDDVQVAIVSMDDGIAPAIQTNPNAPRQMIPVTELHVSAMVNGIDPDQLSTLTPFHEMLSSPKSEDSLDSRLNSFGTSVCRDCQFRKLRSLNLLQVDPSTSAIPETQAVFDKLLTAWTLDNQESLWLPMDIRLVGRDDALANQNGTLISQLSYSVGYDMPNFNWYVIRDPANTTLEQQMGLIKAVPFFGELLSPQQVTLGKPMTARDQQVFAQAAMLAWAQDKPELSHCLQPSANCFVALVDAENPAVTTVNGVPQYLYKYFILIDDKVYSPSSPLSNGQLIRLRSALEGTETGAAQSTTPPALFGPATVQSTILLPTTTPTAATLPNPNVVIMVPPFGVPTSQVNFTDTINMVVGTVHARTLVLGQLQQIWQQALAPATNVNLTTLADVPGFPNPSTADGRPIRTITYRVSGNSNTPIDIEAASQQFRTALAAANLAQIMDANPNIAALASTTLPPFVVVFGQTPVNITTAAVVAPIVESTTTAPSSTATEFVTFQTTILASTAAPAVVLVPIILPSGNFSFNDSVALLADTRRSRDRVLNEQVKPLWQTALGPDVSPVVLTSQRDTPWSTPQTPDGQSIRLIQYSIAGNSSSPVDVDAAKKRFRTEAQTADARSIWAIPDTEGGVLVLAGNTRVPSFVATVTTPSTTISTATAITTTLGAMFVPVVVAVTEAVTTTTTPLRLLSPVVEPTMSSKYQGELILKNFAPTDAPAIEQTLQALWAQALDLNTSNIQIQPLAGGPAGVAEDGSPLYDFRYAVLLHRNITDPATAQSRFIALLTQSDLNELLHVPLTTPASVTTTSASTAPTTVPGVVQVEPVVIPVLSFTEKQDVAISDPNQVFAIVDGLKGLWANASGIPLNGTEIRLINMTSWEPQKFVPSGEVKTLTYGVTLQNATDLPAIRARAEELAPTSPLRNYLVLPELTTTTSTQSTSGAAVIVPVIAQAATTAVPVVVVQPGLPPGVHQVDIYSANVDENRIRRFLQILWAQAYEVPVQRVNLTLLNVEPVPIDPANSDQRPISRETYSVAVPNHPEDQAVVDTFNGKLATSMLAPFLSPIQPVRVIQPPTTQTRHSLPIAVSNAADMDLLQNGIRTSWISTLGLQNDPQDVKIILSNVKPENVATSAGVPVSTLFYNLDVPSNIQVGDSQEVQFRQVLAQSPAAKFVFTPATATTQSVLVIPAVQIEQTTTTMPAITPLLLEDSIILSGTSKNANSRILNQVSKTWSNALAPNVTNVQLTELNDAANVPPTTPEGTPLRMISYQVNGTVIGAPLSDYDAKNRFRQLARTMPISGVSSIPELPAQPTTQPSILEETTISTGAVSAIVVTLPESTTASSSQMPLVIVPVVTQETITTTTTTAVPNVQLVRFLQLKRPVGIADEPTLTNLIAQSWAAENNVSSSDIDVKILSNEPMVDDSGTVGSNITYQITAKPSAIQNTPTQTTEEQRFAQQGWPVCYNCLIAPLQKFYVTLEDNENENSVDPSLERRQVLNALVAANPQTNPQNLQVAFPQGEPPTKAADLVSPDGKSLLSVSYYSVDNTETPVQPAPPPRVEQLQKQFLPRVVYAANDSSLVHPIRLLLQRDGSWNGGSVPPLDDATEASIQKAVDSAIQSAVQNGSQTCDKCSGRKIGEQGLIGRFGKFYSELTFLPENVGNLSSEFVSNITKDSQSKINNEVPQLQAVNISENLVTNEGPINPQRVYFYDFEGKPNIFTLQAQKANLTAGWLVANPNCLNVNCSYSPLLLATQKRVALSDGREITRVYYTIKARTPYALYPPQSVSTVIQSKPVQQATLLSNVTGNQEIEAALHSAVSVGNPTARKRRQIAEDTTTVLSVSINPVSTGGSSSPGDVNVTTELPFTLPSVTSAPTTETAPVTTVISVSQASNDVFTFQDSQIRYCYHPDNNKYTAYRTADFVQNNNDAASANLKIQPTTVVTGGGQPACKNCICDIPAFKALVKGHVNASQFTDLNSALVQPWIDKYGNVTQDMTGIAPSNWKAYIIDNLDYRYTEQTGPLTLLTYGVMVGGAAPSQLLIDDLNQAEVAGNWNSQALALCTPPQCKPKLDSTLYASGLPTDQAALVPLSAALKDAWKRDNPSVSDIAINNVSISSGYAAQDANGSYTIPVQRMDYQVEPAAETNWNTLDTIKEPSQATLSSNLRAQNANISVFPSGLVRQSQATQGIEGTRATPYWLPAAIIIPLAGVIAFTILLVLLITRASKIFRSKKMVIITDPSMIQKSINEGALKEGRPTNDVTSFREGNGKSNMAFDDYHNGRQDISKV